LFIFNLLQAVTKKINTQENKSYGGGAKKAQTYKPSQQPPDFGEHDVLRGTPVFGIPGSLGNTASTTKAAVVCQNLPVSAVPVTPARAAGKLEDS
jgi:hypothetical protein